MLVGFGLVIYLLVLAIVAAVLYVVVRLGVAAGIRDARRREERDRHRGAA